MAKILMVAPQPFFRARGTPFSVLHRIRALTTRGHQVHLVTYPFGENIEMQGLTITRCPPVFGIKDVQIGPSVSKLFLDFSLLRLTASLLKCEKFDFIHSHEEAAFFCTFFAKKHAIPHIYDMHSSLPQQFNNFSKFNIWPVRRIFEKLECKVLGSADGIITICNELAEIAAPFVTEKPHAMIENTADDRKVFSDNNVTIEIEDQLHGLRVVLYTGTLEQYQGVDVLLESFKLLSNVISNTHLLVVGGTQNQVDNYRKQAQGLGIEQKVTFIGMVDPSKIPAFIELADVIVSPRSKGTNTPLKICGYMRSGKPIVATDLLTHTQILNNSTACLVPPDAEGLANGLKQVLTNYVLASQLAKAAQDYASQEFSDDAYIDKVNSFFDCVMDKAVGGKCYITIRANR